MASPSAALLQHFIRSATVDASSVSDRELLARFAGGGDQAAFAMLVRRHSGMVLGVCRRSLPTTQDAEDACQATFLLLARKAKSTRWRPSVANWLYTTARRVAGNAVVAAKRRARREGRAAVPEAMPPVDRMTGRELLAILDRELDRLPSIYREPLVLCYLEGLTHDEVAARLGIAPSTVKVRIHRGRKRLHAALTRSGATLGAGLLALAATSPAEASLGDAILAAASGTPSASVAALAQEAAKGVSHKVLWAALAVVGTLALGVTVRPKSFIAANPPSVIPTKPMPPVLVKDIPPNQAQPDRDPEALPPGALARLGTTRLRHSGWVWAVAFTPDGKQIASASQDGTIRLWDASTGKELRRFTGHAQAVGGIVLSADGRVLASAGGDGTIRLWQTATGRESLNVVRAHEGSRVSCVALSPDGKTLASGGGGNGHRTLVLWNAADGKELHVLGDKRGSITSVVFSPDGKVLAAGGWDQVIDLWDVATGKRLRRLTGHDRGVASLTFSPDGATLISGSHDDTVRVWDPATGRELLQLQGQGGVSKNPFAGPMVHDGGVHSVTVSPNGKVLASGGCNGTVRLWDATTGKELIKLDALSREVQSLAFSPDGQTLATAGFDHVIHLWDPATGKRVLPTAGHDSDVEFVTAAKQGRRVASVSHDRTIRVWDAGTGQELRVLRGHKDFINCAAFSPDGQTLASGDFRGVIKLWDVATGRELRECLGHNGYVMSVAFSPDGKLLVSGSFGSGGGENSVRLWDPATGRELKRLKEEANPQNPFLGVEFLPDGKSLAARCVEGIMVLDLATGKELRRFAGRGTRLGDGRVLTDDLGMLRLLDAVSGQELGRFTSPLTPVRQFTCSPDGRTLAWALESGPREAIELLEVATGKVRRRFTGHDGAVTAVAFCADGKTLVSASRDTTLLVWDLTSAK